MKTPVVSVILSVFNSHGKLPATLESILNQDFKEFEFLVVDDGSQDDSWSIITRYARTDARIVPIQNVQNEGLIHSLNKALVMAQGRYVARIDCGDYSRSDRLGLQVEALERNPHLVLVGSQAEWVSANGRTIYKTVFPCDDRSIRSALECGDNIILHPTVMFRRLAGVLYHANAKYAEDYALWLSLLSRGEFFLVDELLTCIEFDPNGATYKHRIEQTRSVGRILKAYGALSSRDKGLIIEAPLALNSLEVLQEEMFHRWSQLSSSNLLEGKRGQYVFFRGLSALCAPDFVFALLRRRACRFSKSLSEILRKKLRRMDS